MTSAHTKRAFKTSAALLASFLLASTTIAQTQPCASGNDSNSTASTSITAFGFAGENRNAWSYTPTSSVVARGLRIFTKGGGAAGPFMSIEIWDNDATTMLPKSRLAGGSWHAPMQAVNEWQGANLDKVVVLSANTTYWFVWVDPGFSAVPEEPNGILQMPRARRSGTTWVSVATPGALKFRLYCLQLDEVGVGVRGSACGDSKGSLGTAFTNQSALLGNSNYRIEGSGFPSGAAALLILGADKNFMSVPFGAVAPGCSLNTDIVVLLTAASGTGNTRSSTAVGIASHVFFPFPIPTTPSLRGAYIGAQIAVLDTASSNALPFVFSNGLTTTVQ